MNKQSGQILVLTIVAVGIVLTSTLAVIAGSQIFSQNANYTTQSTQATNLAEAGVDKALASLNTSGGTYTGEAETVLDTGAFSVTITTSGNNKIIESTGYVPSKLNPKAKRTIKITASKGIGTAFNYGVQVGDGGLEMSENSRVNGSVYSNGNIKMENNSTITGDAYVAGGVAPSADQQNDCSAPSCSDFIFGKNVNGDNRLDVAQSFKPSATNILAKVAVKLKKTGSPPDITVRILGDKNSKPDKNNVIATGTLYANLVTNDYSFIEVAFVSSPSLQINAIYWVMLDTSSDSSNYWSWSADSSQSYNNGRPMWSPQWNESNPNWYTPASPPIDLNFQTYMGGTPTYIQGGNGTDIGGDAHANTLKNLNITSGAYFQTAQSITAGSMHPGSADPTTKVMPVSDANINAWKNQAQEVGVYTGDINSCRATLGPGKYVGNVTFSNNCTITVKDPIWITGNLALNNGVTLKLDPSYGASSGVIVVDGTITLSNIAKIVGSGSPGSYLMTVSNFDSRTSGQVAINVANSGNEAILYAPYGLVDISNNNQLNEVTAWKIELDNGVVVNYESGLASTFFSSGPSGSYSLVKGTYQLK